jgi:hypothetical protein
MTTFTPSRTSLDSDLTVSGSAFISGTLEVSHLTAHTVISSSHLIISDAVIGLGFGHGTATGSVGDRGFIFGLEGNLNQAIFWDQTSGSFVMGKVGAQGPHESALDVTEPNLSSLRVGGLQTNSDVSGSDTLFINAENDRVGIRRKLPNAVLHLSQSGATDNEGKPMLLIETPGAREGKQQTKPVFIVTSSIPDDYNEGRVGINTDDPSGVFHIKSKLDGGGGNDTLVVHDNKIVIGDTNANAKFAIHNNKDTRNILRIDTTDDDDFRYGLFYISGSGDTSRAGVFGSDASGSALAVSGSSRLSSVSVDYTGSVSADYTVKGTDYAIEIDSSAGSLKVFLPSAASAGKGRIIAVKDGGNNANSNNIKITGSTASDLIEYGVETLISDDKGSKTVISDGVRKWFVIGKV